MFSLTIPPNRHSKWSIRGFHENLHVGTRIKNTLRLNVANHYRIMTMGNRDVADTDYCQKWSLTLSFISPKRPTILLEYFYLITTFSNMLFSKIVVIEMYRDAVFHSCTWILFISNFLPSRVYSGLSFSPTFWYFSISAKSAVNSGRKNTRIC